MRFKKNQRYMGIVYNKSTMHVDALTAQLSGIKEIFTRTGKPYCQLDADTWFILPDNDPRAQAEVLEFYGKGKQFRQTNRVVPCENLAQALADGYELITM